MAHPIIPYPRSASSKPTIIYGLCDPDTGELRYVGKTILGIRARLNSHVSGAKRNITKYHSVSWLRSLAANGKRPEIFEIETVAPYGNWQEAETYWIAFFLSVGAALTNCSSGGDGGASGLVRTDEWKKKISEAQIGKIVSDETRARIGMAGKGRKLSTATREKMSIAKKTMQRRPMSDAAKANLSAINKGKPGCVHTDEAKRKISEAHKGRKHSAENIEKQRAITRAKWADPAFREKNLAARRAAKNVGKVLAA